MTEFFQSYNFPFEAVCPAPEEIASFVRSGESDDEHPVSVFVKEIMPQLHVNQDICGGYVVKGISAADMKNGIIRIENTDLQVGRQICGYLKEASHLALFVCTAGSLFTELTKKYNHAGDYMEAYIVDAIGTLTVERTMDKIQELLSLDSNARSLKTSNRYSPGYCNWALNEQQKLFELIGENPTGVSLSKSCLMTPIKSVSGIIGIGKDVVKKDYGCSICRNTNCLYRTILNRNRD